MFFQKEMETLPTAKLKALQLQRMQDCVARCVCAVPMYKDKFEKVGFSPAMLRTLSDVQHMPFTTKDDLRLCYPYNMFAVPMKKVVRLHASSGTTGKPTVVGYTKKDLDIWSDLIARLAVAVGVTDDDIAQIAFGYGLFTGAFGLHYGLEKVGCSVIPMSSGNSEKQLMLLQDFEPTVLISTPSYAVYLGEMVQEKKLLNSIHLKTGMFGAEGCSNEARGEIEKLLGLVATDNYGMSELMGPGVSGECVFRNGLHIQEDHFFAEIIDPDTLLPLPDGEYGELVVTAMTKEALPIIRYRTRDITRIIPQDCQCGRTFRRMDKVRGRSDDMLIIKGVNVFPTQIESVIMGIEHLGPHYLLIVERINNKDYLEVQVELLNGELLEDFAELEKLERLVVERIHSVLGLKVKIRLVSPRTIERFQGKAKRVIDKR